MPHVGRLPGRAPRWALLGARAAPGRIWYMQQKPSRKFRLRAEQSLRIAFHRDMPTPPHCRRFVRQLGGRQLGALQPALAVVAAGGGLS